MELEKARYQQGRRIAALEAKDCATWLCFSYLEVWYAFIIVITVRSRETVQLLVKLLFSLYKPLKFDCFYIGESEGPVEQMRSILAQFDFVYTLKRYEIQGVPFRTYLYVPEEHPETKSVFYEREDEAHLIKVGIAMYFVVIISYTV